VFIQVLFGSESTSVTGKQFRSNIELNNETFRQVHKTFVNIVWCYAENLLVMKFMCLRVSVVLHVICAENNDTRFKQRNKYENGVILFPFSSNSIAEDDEQIETFDSRVSSMS